MNRVIHKYQLQSYPGPLELYLPEGAIVLATGEDEDPAMPNMPVLWIEADQSARLVPRKFYIYYTGDLLTNPPPDHVQRHVGTVVTSPKTVFHVYEVVPLSPTT